MNSSWNAANIPNTIYKRAFTLFLSNKSKAREKIIFIRK